jgi:hypothetical protein
MITGKPEWSHDISKQELVKKLEDIYSSFNKLPKNIELHLLLGDISHFLYNLEAEGYNKSAIDNYTAALAINKKEYRAMWFMGNHYAFAAKPKDAVELFLQAEALLPKNHPADFWEEYAHAMFMANMLTHSIYAMERSFKITGKAGSFEKQIGPAALNKIKLLDTEREYEAKDMWDLRIDKMVTFTSRPLGLSVSIDSTWGFEVSPYKNRRNSFLIFPPKISNKDGIEIGYTNVIIAHAAKENDKLEDFVNSFVQKYEDKSQVDLGLRYDKSFGYEVKDQKMYSHMGGAHLYIIGVERASPEYPGLLLETPSGFPDPADGDTGTKYYTSPDIKDRINDRMFYIFILDTCEDIHDKCLPLFKNLLNSQVILE